MLGSQAFRGSLLLAAWATLAAACRGPLEPFGSGAARAVVTGLVVRGVVTDDAFQDSLRVFGTLLSDQSVAVTLAAADERAGTYAVHLEGPGYEAWDTTGVRVTRDECHVITATFTARLTPTSP